jgi:hypothetical protein
MIAAAQDAPILFTQEECAAMVKRRPYMAQFLKMGQEMGIAKIVDESQVNDHGKHN